MKNILKFIALSLLVLTGVSCNTEYLDPNSTLEPDVVNSTDNLIKLINGIQQRWSSDRSGVLYTNTHISGLNTGELRLLNPGNLGENGLVLGGVNVDGGNEILNNIWTNAMLCRKEANTIINAADQATDNTELANSLKAYGLFYRALVHGTLIQVYERIPVEIIENAPFVDKSAVLQNAIADLEEAKSHIGTGISSEVVSGVFGSVDIENSVNALLARFNLMAGNYTEAVTAATEVDLNVKSTWEFDAAVPNALAFWFGSQNVTQAKDTSFGLPGSLMPDPADARIPFYVTAEDFSIPSPNYQVVGFYTDNLDEVPVYLPGEMLLIIAESHARNNNLVDAEIALNAVLTKTATTDVFGLGAGLPVYSGALTQEALLDEIYKNRRIELYLSGLGLEDTRRFGRPGAQEADAERNRDYYPYPNAERDNNTNTPVNPTS
ncbi:RagB/SusD family nutrient uptake outer membrane protein [Maribacter sp.]|uniref:RagB/SusD family nutrient uptake outer membrane protein n=1 Tax=Maribacter sp. TaxID=1897614 RepID=UPI0025BF45AB|nr:RagB/SusD family nutrient uptake outer membrane protein [Maribacter sp.]